MEARNNLLGCLTGTSWGTSATTLRIGALAIMYSAAEYVAPVWGHSAHMKRLDTALNNTLRIITGCLHPTPTAILPPLAGIAPAKLQREEIVDRLARQALSISNHLLSCNIPHIHQFSHQCLVSWKPFPRHAANLIASNLTFNAHGMWNGSRFHAHPSSVCVQTSLLLQVHHYYANSGSPLSTSDQVWDDLGQYIAGAYTTQPFVCVEWRNRRHNISSMTAKPYTPLTA